MFLKVLFVCIITCSNLFVKYGNKFKSNQIKMGLLHVFKSSVDKRGVVACACNPAKNGSYKLIQPRTQVLKLSHVFRMVTLKVGPQT